MTTFEYRCTFCRSVGDHTEDCPLFESVELDPWPRRGPGSNEVIEMAEFTVGPHEVICQKCWLIHRPDIEC